jgi:hypothetical protein
MIGVLVWDRSLPRQRVEEGAKPLLVAIEIGLACYIRSRTVIQTASNFQARHMVSPSGEDERCCSGLRARCLLPIPSSLIHCQLPWAR